MSSMKFSVPQITINLFSEMLIFMMRSLGFES